MQYPETSLAKPNALASILSPASSKRGLLVPIRELLPPAIINAAMSKVGLGVAESQRKSLLFNIFTGLKWELYT